MKVLTLLFLLTSSPALVNGITYNCTNKNTPSSDCCSGEITLDPTITTIPGGAFHGCSNLTGSLIIPPSVTFIGSYAFSNCFGFTGSLTIPSSVTSLASYAFYNCFGFTGSLIIPSSVTSIRKDAFYNCFGFTGSLTIPSSVTSIGSSAFYNCFGFTGSLTIPSNVTRIRTYAFYNCSGFTGSLTIPSSVTSIQQEAFAYCTGFSWAVTFPNSTTSLGSDIFIGNQCQWISCCGDCAFTEMCICDSPSCEGICATTFPNLTDIPTTSTSKPSVAPSISPLSAWKQVMEVFPSTLSPNSRSQLLYTDLGMSGNQEFGGDVEFNALMKYQIPDTLITQYPVSMTFYSMSGDEMLELDDRSDQLKVRDAMRNIKCEDSGVLRKLLNRLNLFSISQSPTVLNTSYHCGWNTWTVLRCGSISSVISNLLLCVNCSHLLNNYCTLSPSDRSLTFPPDHYYISSSDPSSDPVGKLSMLYLQFNDQVPPPALLKQEVISVTNTSVEVTVIMSDQGYLLCDSYLASTLSSPSSSEVLFFERVPIIGVAISPVSSYPVTSTSATYSLTNLIPSSSYNIYCASLSLTSAPTPTELMLNSRISVSTLCCRLLVVTLNQMVVDDVSVVAFALTFDVGSQKVDNLLKISIAGIDQNSLVRREMFVPSLVQFSLSSSFWKFHSTYIPVIPGLYRLNVTLSGPSSSDYRVTFPAGDVLLVKRMEDVLPPPNIQRLAFSSDGSKIEVTFTSPTNRGVVNWFSCSLLFDVYPPTRCVWTSDSSLEMSLIRSFNIGDTLKLKKGVLKARCTSKVDPSCMEWTSNNPQNITISIPSAVTSPVVIASIASQIGPCDDLVVDLTSSSGSGGRPWKSVSFTVLVSDPNTTLFQDFLSLNISTNPLLVRTPFVIPKQMLTPGYGYSMEVKLCNFLNGCGSSLKNFVVSPSSSEVPVVVLNSHNKISIFRSGILSISGDGYTSSCESKSRSHLLYTWSLLQRQIPLSSPEFRSISSNPYEFKLPAYRLLVGSLYNVKLTVRHSKSLKFSSSMVEVFVNSGNLKCQFLGGEDLGLRMDGSLMLDLSSSSDSNIDPTSDEDSGLLFELICFRVAPSYNEDCESLIFAPLTSSFAKVKVTVNSSSSVTTNDVFKILMRGRSSYSSSMNVEDSRRCEKVIQLSILDALAPSLALQVLSGSVINPTSKLKILATVNMISRGDLSWSLSDDSIDLASISLSPISRSLPPSPSNSSFVLSLVIVGNSLPPQSSFVFTLSCSLVNGYSSSSTIAITTNSPPFGGALEVSPSEGVMLETVYSMIGLDWVDDDLPLSYQFGYISSREFSPNSYDDMIILRSKLELAYTTTLLPSGPSKLNSSTLQTLLSCVVLVFDVIDSSSFSLFDVVVEEVDQTLDDLKEYLLTGINATQRTSNSESLKNTLSLASTLLNKVDCSSAPDCDVFNRQKCSLTQGTCGECLPGFVGLIGSSNTLCVPSQRRLHSSAYAGSCNSNMECADLGFFFECSLQSHQCQSIQKSCPNSCSGHGRCVFVSKYDLQMSQSRCDLIDLECLPHCDCDENYSGSSCSLTVEDMLRSMEIRQLLVENIGALMSIENPWKTNVKSWMKSLSLLASDYLSLSDESKTLMTSFVIKILQVSRELELSIEDLPGMDKAVDLCMSRLFSSISMSDDGTAEDTVVLFSLLREYSGFVTSDMLENQFPVSSITPYVRSSSFHLSPTSTDDLSSPFSIPETGLENYLSSSSPQQSIELSSDYVYPIELSISETIFKAIVVGSVNSTENVTVFENRSQISPPLVVTLKRSPCSSNENEDTDVRCLMSVVLQNKAKKPSTSVIVPSAPPSFDVTCVKGVVEEYFHMCPSGQVLTISCNGSISMKSRRYCPERSTEVECQTTVQSSSTNSRSQNICRLSEHNDLVTICLCDLSKVGVLGGDDSVSFSIMSVQKSVSRDFVSTWETLPNLSSGDVADSWMVLVTVGSLSLIFFVMMLIGIQSDKRHFEITSRQNIQKRAFPFSSSIAPRDPLPTDSEGYDDEKLIEDALPSIFNTHSLWNKLQEEMKIYHRWLGIVFYYSPEFPRSMRVLSLFSSIVIMLFVQSVTYNISDPDDGSCESCDDESCCLLLESTLNSNEERCYWKPSSSPVDEGSCHFRKINEDITHIFIVAMISAIVSAPFALSLQYLIMNVLSRDTVATEAEEKQRKTLDLSEIHKFFSSRKLSVEPEQSSKDLVEICGGSVSEDLDNLLKELSRHYQYLLKEDKVKAKEFLGELDF